VRTREADWLDTKSMKTLFGIQVRVRSRWCYAHSDGKPLIYATKAERDAKRAELRRQPEIKESP